MNYSFKRGDLIRYVGQSTQYVTTHQVYICLEDSVYTPAIIIDDTWNRIRVNGPFQIVNICLKIE